MATEKDRYASVAEGIKVVVDIYVDVLKKVSRRKKLRALVHPVVPVLDVTRHIVSAFNSALQSRVVTGDNALEWVDIGSQLLQDEGKLKKELELDGTHLSPEYLKLLAAGLANLEGVP